MIKLTTIRYLILIVPILVGTVQAEQRDLIIVAGQSNAVGFDAKPSLLPPSKLDERVMFWFKVGDPPPDDADSTSSNSWTTLKPQPLGKPLPRKSAPRQYGNFAQADGGFGPEIGCCRAMLTKRPDRKLAVIKAAFSGTSVPQDWDPDGDATSSACYVALINQIRKATKAAKTDGITLKPKFMIWIQGESDATKDLADAYADNLKKMLVAVRKDIDAPQLMTALAVNTRFGKGNNRFMPKIVESQKQVANKDNRITYVDTSQATIANGAHYDTKGTLQVGKWIAESLIKLEGERIQ